MANATRYGFKIVQKGEGKDVLPRAYPAAGSEAIAIGDVVALDSAGRIALATSTTTEGTYVGVAATPLAATASAGDTIFVYDDPNAIFEAMVSTGALADCYTTRSCAACFDITGSTGAQYVNSSSSSYDVFRVIGEAAPDPVTGVLSAVGTNQMKYVKFSPLAHAYGAVA